MCNLFGHSEDVGPLVNIGLLAKLYWLVSAEQSMNLNNLNLRLRLYFGIYLENG